MKSAGTSKPKPPPRFIKSKYPGCSIKKAVFENFAIFTLKEPVLEFQAVRPTTFLKKRLPHRCFPGNIANVLRIPIL